MRGLFRLTWLEVKIFLREPLGAIGSIVVPVASYVLLGRTIGPKLARAPQTSEFAYVGLPVLASMLILISAVLSLVTIVAIYREGGILKRLRATPLRPLTILTAHVLVKLLFTAATLVLMVLAGKRYYPFDLHIPLVGFTAALLAATLATLSLGFVIASLVRNARFAQPAAALIFYPMLALSGLFFPLDVLTPGAQTVARLLPLTYVVSLLRGVLQGDPWSAHGTDAAALALVFLAGTALSARFFRWE